MRVIRTCLRPGSWFVFETRRSEVRDWETWDLAPSPVAMPGGRTAVVSCAVTEVALPLVSFEGSTAIGEEIMRSTSTPRFRECKKLERDLSCYGFNVLRAHCHGGAGALWPFGSFMDYAIEGAARTVGRTRAAGRRLRRPLIRKSQTRQCAACPAIVAWSAITYSERRDLNH